ncbi:hypothetical protein [Pseudolysinimonas sp.]|uniref:hypothetical protein n=1 Tax=Pseudolysinimonas sp. TaxID=2680009 RepID=UPI00286A80C4|nr:hypothetical protein [Pseudolysinimonas sp.]
MVHSDKDGIVVEMAALKGLAHPLRVQLLDATDREQFHQLTEELSDVLDGFVAKYRNQRVPGARPVQVHLDVFPLIDGVEQPGDVGGAVKDKQ